LTGELPFDRHDWVVDRCGQEVRYVIDFYFYDDKAGTSQVGGGTQRWDARHVGALQGGGMLRMWVLV
jgi:hypothetical protein